MSVDPNLPGPSTGMASTQNTSSETAVTHRPAAEAGEPAVELRGLTKRFGEIVTAVDAIDLKIGDGEFFAMLGPSGCGKTTTLRMIAGLEFPTEGSLKIYGDEMGTLAANKRPVNTVFQNYALFPHMTILENVAFGLRMQKVGKAEASKRAQEAIEMVRLGQMAKRKPDQLSGGQQQRIALARALVNRPKVLLLDEPLGALDLKLRQEMQVELKTLQREVGITFVFVTHDQEEALTLSDRIAVMHEGKLLQVASPETMYEHPANRFVADFIGQTNLLEGTIEDSQTVCLGNGSRIAVANSSQKGDKVAVSLRPERISLHPIEADFDGPRLEGVIKSVTYLGTAHSYRIGLDWMEIEVREENRPSRGHYDAGDQVALSWHQDGVWVVVD